MSNEKPGAGQTALVLARKRGGILNVASMAAFVPGPLMAIVYASKAFVLSFSEALWEEARDTGVHAARMVPFLPRATVLKIVRNLQSPAAS